MRIIVFFSVVLFSTITFITIPSRAADADANSPSALAKTRMPANVVLLETVMRRDALHRLNSTSGVRLPRIRVFNGRGDKLLYVVGWEKDVPARLKRALDQAHPLPQGESLADLLAQTNDSTGQSLHVENLPSSDVVIVTAWAGWCLPCAAAISGLRDAMAADPGRNYLWITVETDALKQKLLLPGVRSGG